MQNIHKCAKCELYSIDTEKHDCPLEGATHIGYVLINGNWYIEWVLYRALTGEYESKIIHPIPIPSYIRRPTQNQHDFKHEDDSTEPLLIIFSIIY
jgi:hypothetical protein